METSIIKIGNSKGIVIPKKYLEKLGEVGKVDISLKSGGIFIAAIGTRKNWEFQFADALKNGFEPEETDTIENDFDKNEWTW